MSNFDLRKYLAEGRLLKESQYGEPAYNNSSGLPPEYEQGQYDYEMEKLYDPFHSNKIAITKDDKNTILLDFIKQSQREVAKQVGAIRLEDIMIDDSNDVGATGIFNVGNEDKIESGLAFRFPEDVTSSFKGEEGDEPKPITIAGKKLMYIGYNI